MNVIRDNLAKHLRIFYRTYELARKNPIHLKPLFSISSAHSRAFSGLAFPPNPFSFYRLRTSRDNYRGWGCPAFSPPAHLAITVRQITPSFSIPYKRVRNLLKISNFKYLCLHTHAHSFPASPAFSITSQKHTGGYTPKCPILGFSPLKLPSKSQGEANCGPVDTPGFGSRGAEQQIPHPAEFAGIRDDVRAVEGGDPSDANSKSGHAPTNFFARSCPRVFPSFPHTETKIWCYVRDSMLVFTNHACQGKQEIGRCPSRQARGPRRFKAIGKFRIRCVS